MNVIIDGNALAYRAFYKAPPLTNSNGVPTSVVHAFLQTLLSLKERLSPSSLTVVFDAKGPTKRHTMLEEYKATRQPMPEDLSVQIEHLKTIVPLMGIPMYSIEGVEADDVIHTLAKDADGTVYIVTRDKDLHQLVDERVKVYDPSSDAVIEPDDVTEKLGVPPEQVLDLLALMGDKSDNIPGVDGIGPKKAVDLLTAHGSLDGIFEHVDSIKGKLGEKLAEQKERAYLSKKVATLEYLPDLERVSPERNDSELKNTLAELELKTILERIFDAEAAEGMMLEEGAVEKPLLVAVLDDGIYIADNGHFAATDESVSVPAGIAVYDVKRLIKAGVSVPEDVFDLFLASWMVDPDSGGLRPAKNQQAADFLQDVVTSIASTRKQLEQNGLTGLYEGVELPVARILANMELLGIKADASAFRSVSADIGQKLGAIEGELTDRVGHEINLNSPKQLSAWLFDELGLKPPKKTKTGYSTSEDTLKELAATDPDAKEPVEMILKYRELAKLQSTYALALPEYIAPDGRIHTEFRQTGTATGRLSSVNPNLQNIPARTDAGRKLRHAFRAKDGYAFVSFDYSQIELRLLAHLADDEAFQKAFADDLDIHDQTARAILGGGEEVDSETRRIAKAVNFGIIYGLSPYGLARDTGVSPGEARTFIDTYFKLHPAVKTFLDDTVTQAGEKGYVSTIMGRRRYIRDITSRNGTVRQRAERIAMNAPIQGSAADVIKLAMINGCEYIKKSGVDARLLLQIHDELIFEVASNAVDGFFDEMKRIMESVVELSVPLRVNGSTGDTWGALK